jgi:hypothetical protein
MMNEKTTAPVEASTAVDAEFVDLRGLEARYGIKRSLAYALMSRGDIKSVCLRRRGCLKGKRLVSCASVRSFLASLPDDIDPALSEQCRKAQIESAKSKAEAKAQMEAK